MTAARTHSAGPRINHAMVTWMRENGAPVIKLDFSHLDEKGEEKDSSYAVAGRNLGHTGLFHYEEKDRSPQGETYTRNNIVADDAKRQIKVIGLDNCNILIRWSHKHNPELNEMIMAAADRWAKASATQYKHHKNYANWKLEHREDETPVLVADFSHLAQVGLKHDLLNPHYWGAQQNLEKFGKLRVKDPVQAEAADKNDVAYDPPKFGGPLGQDPSWQIRIAGKGNCRAFINWIKRDDIALSQTFDELGITARLTKDLRPEPGPESGRLFADEVVPREKAKAAPRERPQKKQKFKQNTRPLFGDPDEGTGAPDSVRGR